MVEVLLDAASFGDMEAELNERGSAGPGKQATDKPDEHAGSGRRDVDGDLRWDREDGGADLKADDEGEVVGEGEGGVRRSCRRREW